MERVDTVVIGAGVIGLAVARALAQAGCEAMLLEKDSHIGTGVSSRNSEVIHAGLYYTPGSLKARLCVTGKRQLYAYAAEHGVTTRACGKLVVATDNAQQNALDALAQKAKANGVETHLLTGQEAQAREPALSCVAALWSPTTGIVDSHGLMLALLGDLEAAGGLLAVQSTVVGGEITKDGIVLRVRSPFEGDTELLAQRVVNAASLHATQIASSISGFPKAYIPQAYYAKGSYFSLNGASPFRSLIYPAPQDAWLGIHLTLDLGGQTRFGPDLEWLDDAHPDALDYAVAPERAQSFYADVRRYWPDLPDGALAPSYSGIRPKIHAQHQAAPDFRIDGPAIHGVAGWVNLFGIESPGLTSALALGDYVRDILVKL
jgi:L-2-hydroxyglutarate oxidase LhgO